MDIGVYRFLPNLRCNIFVTFNHRFKWLNHIAFLPNADPAKDHHSMAAGERCRRHTP